MKNLVIPFFIYLSLLSLNLSANFVESEINKDKIKWVKLSKIAPTQFNIGILAMEEKRDKMIEKYNKELKSKKNLEKYLLEKAAPAYLGENGQYYIVDRHHTSRALYEANLPVDEFPVIIIKDLSDMDLSDLFDYLGSINGLYLYENGQGPLDPRHLPDHIWELDDDPYRSLAWLVREAGGFDKAEVNFLEFIWANYFRKKITLVNGSEAELNQNLKRAIEMAHEPDASHLPGYTKN